MYISKELVYHHMIRYRSEHKKYEYEWIWKWNELALNICVEDTAPGNMSTVSNKTLQGLRIKITTPTPSQLMKL